MMEMLCRLGIPWWLTFEKSTTLKQWFLHYKFLQCWIMAEFILEEFANDSKLMKVAAISK